MKTLQRIAVGGALVLTLTGCGSLKVRVAVLNPATVEAELDRLLIVQTLPKVVGETEADARAQVREYQQEHFNFISKLAEQYQNEADATSDPTRKAALTEIAQMLLADFSEQMVPYYQEVSDKLVAANTAVGNMNAKEGQSQDPKDQARLARQLRIRGQLLEGLEARVRDEIGAATKALPLLSKPRRQLARKEVETFNTQRRSIIPGLSISADPVAYVVASAPEELWADNFNLVDGKGLMGNFNMAVKLEESGSYTIKGLTFDPSDVARVASKVTTQALLIATQLAGVPIQTQPQANAPAGAALAASSKALAEAEKARAQQKTLLFSHKDALQSLAGTILREWPSLDNDDAAKRKAAIAAIRSGFTANQSRLRLEAAPASPATGGNGSSDGGEEEP